MCKVNNSWRPLTTSEICNHQRAYELLGNDLMKIFAFVEPSKGNKNCYGHEIYQLLLRVCTEFESVCKLAKIRLEHEGNPDKWNITSYSELNDCKIGLGVLSKYKFEFVEYPDIGFIQPLQSFSNNEKKKPEFYAAYTEVKHDRNNKFSEANLWSLLNSYAGLTAVMFWQGIDTNISGWLGLGGYINTKFGRFECPVESGEPIYGCF